jgi:hypothetical protein
MARMKQKILRLQTWYKFAGTCVLLVGLTGAAFVYLNVGHGVNDTFGYSADNGYVYPISPENSKKYLRDLELYGGKANVFAYELRNWFAELFHGRPLAYTIAIIAILISLILFNSARRVS